LGSADFNLSEKTPKWNRLDPKAGETSLITGADPFSVKTKIKYSTLSLRFRIEQLRREGFYVEKNKGGIIGEKK